MPTLDLEVEKTTAVHSYNELITAGRQLPAKVVFYNHEDRILMATSRPVSDEKDFYVALMQMLLTCSGLHAHQLMVTFPYDVLYSDGQVKPSIVSIAVDHGDTIAEPFPYRVENGEVIWDGEFEIPADKLCYPETILFAIATCMKVDRPLDKPSRMLSFLSEIGFEIEFLGDTTIKNVDHRSYIL